jgi:non-ribosomal peptide synthetase component F
VLASGEQQVLPEVPAYAIATEDLRGRAPEEAAARLAAVREALSHQLLPADRWPLFELRASLLDGGDRGDGGGRLRLHLSLDGLVADGFSHRLLLGEWFTLHRRPETVLPPLSLTFRDYVLAQAAGEDSEEYRRSLAYWRERAPHLPPAPQLPLARPLGSLAEPRFVRRTSRLAAASLAGLRRHAAAAGLTAPAALLAAWCEVLAAWSRGRRFTVSVPRFNRLPLHPEVERLVGELASFTLLGVDLSGRAPFAERARRIQAQLLRDLEHGRVSGVRVLRELARHREGGGRAPMPVVFTSLLFPGAGEAAEAGEIAEVPAPVWGITQTPQVLIDLQVTGQAAGEGGGLAFHLDAVEAMFPPGYLDDLLAAFGRIVERLAAAAESWSEEPRRLLAPIAPQAPPETPEDTAPDLDSTEVFGIARGRVATPAPAPPRGLAHAGFLARAAEEPRRTAVIAAGREISYGELDDLSDRLGRALRWAGARANALVAVVMEKGWEQAVAVLGVLKAGAAYLPIDPEVPAERLAYLLENGEVRLALTQPRLAESLAWPAGVEVFPIADEALAGLPGGPLAPAQTPEDLAYVIYTSGSTGAPKGVMVRHAGLAGALDATNRRFGVAPGSR